MILVGKVSKGTVILPPGADLPEGTEVRIEPLTSAASSRRERVAALRKLAASVEGLPADLARDHDHFAALLG
ncbi:MAG: hypothetical protein Q7S40_19360 [Opitutaceae bacterium]|nr:hypothetical protein [Opitutaceae bacterium]